MDMAKDTEWGVSSGLPEGEFWIDEAKFGYLPEVQNGTQLLLILNGKLTDEDGDVDDHQFRFSVGSGWSPVKGGKEAVKENGKANAMFNANSAYGRFLVAAVSLPGASDVIRSRGNQRQAEVWEGLGFEIAQVKGEFPDRNDPAKKVEFFTATPVRFLGSKGSEGNKIVKAAAKPASSGATTSSGATSGPMAKLEAAKAAKAKATAKPEVVDEVPEDEGPNLEDALTELARNSTDHVSFVSAAYEQYPELDGHELEQAVLEEDQLFATARS